MRIRTRKALLVIYLVVLRGISSVAVENTTRLAPNNYKEEIQINDTSANSLSTRTNATSTAFTSTNTNTTSTTQSQQQSYPGMLIAIVFSGTHIIGLVNNFVTVILLQDDIFTNVTLRVYYLSLATLDSLILLLSLSSFALHQANGSHLLFMPKICFITRFVWSTVQAMSTWLLVVISIERSLCVWRPHKAQLSTISKARVITLTMLGVNLLLWSMHLWMGDYTASTCRYRPEFQDFERMEYMVLSSVSTFAPAVVLSVSYVTMVAGYIKMKRQAPPVSSGSSGNKAGRLTMTVIGICTTYIVLTFPLGIYGVVMQLLKPYDGETDIASSEELQALNVVRFLQHSINLYTYLATGSQFRLAAINTWRRFVSRITNT